jgi:nascent polypeptide-associated complex subunit alpha
MLGGFNLGGVNPKQVQQAMKRMGVSQEELPAKEVIIRLPDKDIIFSNPCVEKVRMMGQESFQISGEFEEKPHDTMPEISDEDVRTVMQQTGVDEATARNAIDESKGDLAAAILLLSEKS